MGPGSGAGATKRGAEGMAERGRGDPAFAEAGGVQSAAWPGQRAQRRQAETRGVNAAGQ